MSKRSSKPAKQTQKAMTLTTTKPEAAAELLPSERLQNVAKMQQKLQDALAAAKKAEQDYQALVQSEHQKLLDQINEFQALVGGAKEETKAEPAVDTAAKDTASNAVKTDVGKDTVVTEVKTQAPIPLRKVETIDNVLNSCSDTIYEKVKEYSFYVLMAVAIVIILYVAVYTATKIKSSDNDNGGGKANAKQMQIIDAVLSDTTLTQNEKYALMSQRLYQEYYADSGTGTQEERREQARQLASKYAPPPVNDAKMEQLLQKVQQLESQIESQKKEQNAAPPVIQPPVIQRGRILRDEVPVDGETQDTTKDTAKEPSKETQKDTQKGEAKPDVNPSPQEQKQDIRPAPKRLQPLFRQRADGTVEPVPMDYAELKYLILGTRP